MSINIWKNECPSQTVNHYFNFRFYIQYCRFKKLPIEEKIAATSIVNEQFIKSFLRFSNQQYEGRLFNFNKGYSILNVLNEDDVSSGRFDRVKGSLRFALMEEELMYMQLVTSGKPGNNANLINNVNLLCADSLISWIQFISDGRCFQMAHKLTNKQAPEDNILWFCSQSFSTLQCLLANQVQKSIIRNYFKKQGLANHKLHQFAGYIGKKHPQHSWLLRLSLGEMVRMTVVEKQQHCVLMKSHQHNYYEDVRMSFIESIENLQRKKKKQKRKVYKRKGMSNHEDEQGLLAGCTAMDNNEHEVCQDGNAKETEKDYVCKQQLVEKNNEIVEEFNENKLNIGVVAGQQQPLIALSASQQGQLIMPTNQQPNLVDNNNPFTGHQSYQQYALAIPVLTNQQQYQQILHKASTSTGQSQKVKNIVYSSRQRQHSPYSKSNIVDNECSKSQFSGQISQTYTQCQREDDYDQNDEKQERQLFDIDGHPLEMNESEQTTLKHSNNINNNHEIMMQDIQSQNDRLKKRRKRKGNNNHTTSATSPTQPTIPNQLSTKIRSHCHKTYTSNLTHFIDHLSIQTNNLYQSKIVVFQRIRYFIKAFYPQSEIMLFGSNSIGLSLATSDVDVMVLNINCTRKEEVKEILAQIAIEINVMAWVVSCSTYLGAKTPLVKLEIDPLISYYETKRKSDYCIYHPQLHEYLDIKDRKKAKNISLDLTISLQPTPYSPSTQLMRSYLNNNPLLQRIILIIKYILTTKAYNKNFSGGLGSYCLFIMITAYFQQYQVCMQKDEGQVLLDVLKFYSQEFQNLVTSITLRDNASCFISLEESLTMANFSQNILSNPLRIIDPLTQKLTSSSCSQYHLIKQEFRRIRMEILSHLESIYNQVQPNFTMKSAKMDGLVLDKNIEKIVHKAETKRKGWLKRVIQGKNQARLI